MSSRLNRLVGVLIAGSMFVSSTGAVAATSAAPQTNPWAALTAMTGGAPAAALCGSAALAAAQTANGCVFPAQDVAAAAGPPAPIPVPPVEPAAAGLGIDPLLLGLGALLAAGLIYLLVRNNNHHHNASPA